MDDPPRTTGPHPATLHPLEFTDQLAFLQPLAKDRPNVTVGPFAYYDDPDGPEQFFERCVRYHFGFVGDKLSIGAFTTIAARAQIIMNGANHRMEGVSAYPFAIFGQGWDEGVEVEDWIKGSRGDTVIGPDVWIGTEAMILPGVTIGAGAIISARAVVSRDVAPYTVVAGNPARPVKERFPPDVVERLLHIAWWDWPAEKITRALPALRSADLDALEAMA